MSSVKAVRIAALGVALVSGGSGLAGAQAAATQQLGGAGAVRGRGNQQLDGIELSAEQKTRLEAITAKYADQNKRVRELMAADPAAAMRQMVAVREKMLPEVRAVLTAEQQAIFDRNIAELKARMNARMKPPAI